MTTVPAPIPAPILTADDLPATIPLADRQRLVEDALALAANLNPCLAPLEHLSAADRATAKAVLRQAVLYSWQTAPREDRVTQEGAGAFQVSYATPGPPPSTLFSAAQESLLRSLCPHATLSAPAALTVQAAPPLHFLGYGRGRYHIDFQRG